MLTKDELAHLPVWDQKRLVKEMTARWLPEATAEQRAVVATEIEQVIERIEQDTYSWRMSEFS